MTDGEARPAGRGVVKPTPAVLMHDLGDGLNYATRVANLPGYLTPADRFYIRNHDATPHIDVGTWRVRIDGTGVRHPVEFGYEDLCAMPQTSVIRAIECAGNGRVFFEEHFGRAAEGTPYQGQRIRRRSCDPAAPVRRRRDRWTAPVILEAPVLGEDGVMSTAKRYPRELRDRAVRMVFEVRERPGQEKGAVARVAAQLGVGRETLRNWVRQEEIDSGKRRGTTTPDAQKIAELERENFELRRANQILRAASAYFARELDPRLPR